MSEASRQRRMLVLCLATVYIVWGTSYVATRVGVLNLPPLLFGGLRFIIAGTGLTAIALWRGFKLSSLRGQWRHLLILSLLCISLSNGLQIWAMQSVQANTSSLLNASCAFWIVLFGLTGQRRHHPGARAVAGLIIGFIGTALLVWPTGSTHAGDAPLLPQLMILASCVFWSLGTIYMRNHTVDIDLFALLGLQTLLGGIWLTLAGLADGEPSRWHWSLPGMGAMAYLVIASSGCAYLAYSWLARHATPAQTGTYSYVNPAITALTGYLLLGEHLSLMQAAGAAVILVGVLMINLPERAARPPG
ncbi:MAG: EamA family transporter [Pseudomonadota bacterium]